jgi:hypothetical protein
VNNVDPVRVHNVYEKTVVNNINITRVSYNGGRGGVTAQPTPQEQNAFRAKRENALPVQQEHVRAAASNRELYASANHGNPTIAATPRPGAFNDHGVVPANHAAPAGNVNNAQHQHVAPQNQPAGRSEAVKNQPQRNANPGGSGTGPLITAHPNNNQPSAAASTSRTPQPGYNNQQQPRPQYKAEGNVHTQPNAPQQHQQNVQPQQQPRAEAPQHTQTARPENQQAPQPQAHYNAPPQQQQRMSAPSQPQHVQSAPQQQHVQPAPQQHMSAPPQQSHAQAAPQQQQHSQAAPQQQHAQPAPQQHVQAAPQQKHENGQPHENAQHDR